MAKTLFSVCLTLATTAISTGLPTLVDDRVSECHEAAKAFCTNGHGFCRTCQAYGSWGSMFFAAVCNDNTKICHQNITTPSGTVCNCQQPGGCKVDGLVCQPTNSTPTPPAPPAPPTPTAPPTPPTPPSDCASAYQPCGSSGHPGCCMGSCSCTGSATYKQCTPPSGQWQCGAPTPPPAPPAPPPPPTPPAPPGAEVIGYWSRTWTPTAAPRRANLGIAFSGWNDPTTALNESKQLKTSLVGAKWIDGGGGNKNGRWSEDNIKQWITAIEQGLLADWQGLVIDIEECYNTGLESSFGSLLHAAKTAGLSTLVTTSHSAPYGCSDGLELMSAFFHSTDLDYLSPQLYTSGGESAPDFDAGNGVKWSDWVGANAKFVPSLTCGTIKAGGYNKTKQFFANINITTAGYIMWPSQGCSI